LEIRVTDESRRIAASNSAAKPPASSIWFEHQAPHLFRVTPSRRREQTAVSRKVPVA
jgi:hypothetical protein